MSHQQYSPALTAATTSATAPARRTYLFGAGIGSSLSPAFHNACYRARGLDWTLSRLDSTDMPAFLERVYADDFGGSAVTMPHKSAILTHADHVEQQAKLIGAANTIFFRTDADGQRRLVATNTDVAGIRDSILTSLPASSRPTASGAESSSHIGLVVGGGGTTRTAVYTLRYELHCSDIYIVNRIDDEASAIIDDFASQGVTGIHQLKTPADVAQLRAVPRFIVNAVPSFEPQTDGEKLARATLTAVLERGQAQGPDGERVVLEMCYFPHTWTTVCQMAQDNGWEVIQGMEAMYHQAVAQQLLWIPETGGVDLLAVGRRGAEEEIERRAQGLAPL
ncbi:uncharacterized protein PFL1_00209 [Pseudozyma flocculosa PF-1]|uniref:Related to quinate 5-dehydrogenase n=1 Tax=Pseudozyma flocculosa TaxID=84751 RepID=A0A5C3ETS7_9BASI|nr:uncharacterized protein PFL1_00209 [Pseudozyma flocculosa PF-1]EPQ32011.1 hypothetical protein PFL1_00209 [Pseudozyma flocculosa PF-1]SPO35065.1 related to quinate 5-dehydrogenase [Pseudozyma flocculosa]